MSQNAPVNTLVCPKCRGEMRAYERSGVTVDQCTECRGIFLDRGELERLVDAESAYADAAPEQQRSAHGDDFGSPKRKKKRGSFLEGLFEGGD